MSETSSRLPRSVASGIEVNCTDQITATTFVSWQDKLTTLGCDDKSSATKVNEQ